MRSRIPSYHLTYLATSSLPSVWLLSPVLCLPYCTVRTYNMCSLQYSMSAGGTQYWGFRTGSTHPVLRRHGPDDEIHSPWGEILFNILGNGEAMRVWLLNTTIPKENWILRTMRNYWVLLHHQNATQVQTEPSFSWLNLAILVISRRLVDRYVAVYDSYATNYGAAALLFTPYVVSVAHFQQKFGRIAMCNMVVVVGRGENFCRTTFFIR